MPREEAERRRGFDPDASPKERAKGGSLFFDDVLDVKVREFNPRYAEAEGALLGKFRHFHSDIYGNREFVEHLRNRGKFFDQEENRERDLILMLRFTRAFHYNVELAEVARQLGMQTALDLLFVEILRYTDDSEEVQSWGMGRLDLALVDRTCKAILALREQGGLIGSKLDPALTEQTLEGAFARHLPDEFSDEQLQAIVGRDWGWFISKNYRQDVERH